MDDRAKLAHVCVLSPRGKAVGGGVLVSPIHIVTCAHVAESAWGNCADGIEEPLDDSIKVVFPWRSDLGERCATVNRETWSASVKGETSGDLAILELGEPVEGHAVLARTSGRYIKKGFEVWGHHANGKTGALIEGTIKAQIPTKWLQLNSADAGESYFVDKGASGCGLFCGDTLVGIVAAYDPSENLKEAYALGAENLWKGLAQLLGAISGETAACVKIDQRIDELFPDFSDDLPSCANILEMLAGILDVAEQSQKAPERLNRLVHLAELMVAKRYSGREIGRLRRELSNGGIIHAQTEPFSGGEMRMAAAEDRAVILSDDGSRDPCGLYNICPLPSVGIDGEPAGTDVGGRLGVDLDEALNRRLKSFRGSASSPASKGARRTALIDDLKDRIADEKPRYYYACRDEDEDWEDVAHMLHESFKGTVPCVLLSFDFETDDREVMRALLKVQKICRNVD